MVLVFRMDGQTAFWQEQWIDCAAMDMKSRCYGHSRQARQRNPSQPEPQGKGKGSPTVAAFVTCNPVVGILCVFER